MKKILVLMITLITMSLNGEPAFSSQDKVFPDYLTESWCPTINKLGFHMHNLGPTETAFHDLCQSLDENLEIEKPVVAIFGGAYGLIATQVLEKTKRITVVLNDLEDRHFKDIQEWIKDKEFAHRLILAPGSFLNIQKSRRVKEFFKESPVLFSVILAANIFHYLSPQDFISGLKCISECIHPSGHALVMNMKKPPALRCKNDQNGLSLIGLMLEAIMKMPSDKINSSVPPIFLRPVCESLRSILYDFNKEHHISFPGYFLISEHTLNPHIINMPNVKFGYNDPTSFFTQPEDMMSWSKIVGLNCYETTFIQTREEVITESDADHAVFYLVHLKKDPVAPGNAINYSNCKEYIDLITRARTVKAKLEELHKGYEFSYINHEPYFVIKDRAPATG